MTEELQKMMAMMDRRIMRLRQCGDAQNLCEAVVLRTKIAALLKEIAQLHAE